MHSLRVKVESAGEGLEAAARKARYRALGEWLQEGDLLLLAHHLDDQMETLLLHWLRGARGLQSAGMPASRTLGPARLARPLLECPQAKLKTYALEHGLTWVEDGSNQNLSQDRNYLRHRVLPVIEERWPHYRRNWQRGLAMAEATPRMLEALARMDLKTAAATQGPFGHTLSFDSLPEDPGRQVNLLHHWLIWLGFPPPGRRALTAFVRGLAGGRHDAVPGLCWMGVELRRHRGLLYAFRSLPAAPVGAWSWEPQRPFQVVGGGCLSARPERGQGLVWRDQWQLRFRQPGQHCRVAGRPGTRSLKKLFQERGIPPWIRSRLPMLHDADGRLAAVADLWICEGFAARASQPGMVLSWEPDSMLL